MPEILSELVAKITADTSELKSGLSDAEKKTEASSKNMADSLRKIGMAMAAAGAAITAAMGLMGKAAIDEEINIKHLQIALKGVGVNYDSVKDSLEAVIAATQRKTGIADNEQRDTLARLILVTKDYNKALKLLPLTLDLAAYSQMGTASAATYLAKAYEELEAGADKIGIRMGTTTVYFKDLDEVQRMVGGTAEAMVNPFSVLSAAMGDVSEAIGSFLIPLIKEATSKIVDIAGKVQDWATENPVLAKTLTIVAVSVGILLTAVGGLILAMPVITSMIASLGVVLHVALGPIGLVSAAIMGLAIGGAILWANWSKVSRFFADAWSAMQSAVLRSVDGMLDSLEKFLGWAPGIGDKIRSAREAISNMVDTGKIKRDLEDLTETVKTEFDKQTTAIQEAYNKERTAAQSAHDAAISAINKEYGIAESTTKNKIQLAQEATQGIKDNYEREKEAARSRYDSEMSALRDIYDTKLATLNAETDATVKALQNQIDAIDKQTAAEELALARAEEQKKLASLTGEEYAKFAAEIARRELLRTRNAEKDALRDQIEEARKRAESRKEQIRKEEEAALASLKLKYETEIQNYKSLADWADADLAAELLRIEGDRIAKLDAEKEKLKAELARLDTAEKADIEFYANQLAAANKQVQDINVAYDKLTKRYDIEIVTHQITVSSGGGSSMRSSTIGAIAPATIGMPQLATVHGGETIIPEESAGIIINFTQPVFFDREDTLNRFADMISKSIDRKQRLRFGGAYNG